MTRIFDTPLLLANPQLLKLELYHQRKGPDANIPRRMTIRTNLTVLVEHSILRGLKHILDVVGGDPAHPRP